MVLDSFLRWSSLMMIFPYRLAQETKLEETRMMEELIDKISFERSMEGKFFKNLKESMHI